MDIRCQDLYEAVWLKPVRTIAHEWGLSDVGLAKVCKKNGIPLPPAGHWSKVAVGRGMKRPPLVGNPDLMIRIQGKSSLKKTLLSVQGKDLLLSALAAITDAPIKSAQRLSKWSQITEKALQKKPDPSGFLSCGKKTFRVSVSENQVSRSINLLDKIELALSASGMTWEVDTGLNHVVGKMYGETISFEIKELYKRFEHIEKHPTHKLFDRKIYTYQFLGDLSFRIDGYYEGRKSWADGKTQRIEEKLPEIVKGVLAAAESMRKRTSEREEQKRRWDEEARKRAEREQIAREEKAFFEATLKEAEEWCQAHKIRQYATHLRKLISERSVELTEAGEKWLSHVEDAARKHDPAIKRLSQQEPP